MTTRPLGNREHHGGSHQKKDAFKYMVFKNTRYGHFTELIIYENIHQVVHECYLTCSGGERQLRRYLALHAVVSGQQPPHQPA